jgi:hypothetical protein
MLGNRQAWTILDRTVTDCVNSTTANIQSMTLTNISRPFNSAISLRETQVLSPVLSYPKDSDAILHKFTCSQ